MILYEEPFVISICVFVFPALFMSYI